MMMRIVMMNRFLIFIILFSHCVIDKKTINIHNYENSYEESGYEENDVVNRKKIRYTI